MKSFISLYKKEIRAMFFFVVVSILIVLAWELFLFYKSSVWPSELILGLSFLPTSFFPLIMLWQGYQSYRHEWKDDTIYMLLTLPSPGWKISLAKLAAGFSYYLTVVLFTALMIFLINDKSFISQLPTYISRSYIYKTSLLLGIAYIIFGMTPYILSQFSCLVSRFYSRFKGLVSIVVFILTNYLIYRIASVISPIFNWLPNIPVKGFNVSMGEVTFQTIYINSAPIVSILLMILFIFFLGSFLLEKYLEV
ncbi:MAG: ABC transporter permease [Bacillota bacterium]